MISRNSADDRPGRTSASMPRVRKISTAAGESLSLIRTLGMVSLLGGSSGREEGRGLSEGPVEPGQQRFDIGGFDGGAAPNSQSGGCVAIRGDVVRDALRFEQRGQPFGCVRL